ncbi:hypothetical protein ACJD0Z_00400 [Flavobacteriaceae bacterium M23B6Z8]
MKHQFLFSICFWITLLTYSQEYQTIKNYKGFIPAEFDTKGVPDIRTDTNSVNALTESAVITLEDFNYTVTEIVMRKSDGSLAAFGSTVEKGSYRIVYLFQHYKIRVIEGVRYRYGISITINADIYTNKKNLDLSSLFQLSILASKNKLHGSLSLEAKGFQSSDLYALMNINASIDEASVQQTIKNTGILIAELNNSNTKLNPVILGREN